MYPRIVAIERFETNRLPTYIICDRQHIFYRRRLRLLSWGVVYRRTVDWRDGAFVLGLDRIPARQALQNVSTPLSAASPLFQRAIETGSVRTNNKLFEASSIVSVGNHYYLVYYAGTEQFLSEMPFTERLLEAGATVIGAWLLVATGMNLRDERIGGD